jgi:hypothetical protein
MNQIIIRIEVLPTLIHPKGPWRLLLGALL